MSHQAVSNHIAQLIESGSWIRRMFEEGARMKQEAGAANVYDFSLGNPSIDPPEAFFRELAALAQENPASIHSYMPNTGYPGVRAAVAKALAKRFGYPFTADHVIMTVGAAGAINITLKAILDKGDEVIVLAPYFVEYRFYVDNHGGKTVVVQTTAEFDPDLDAIDAAITPRTRAVIINSPNNPSGRVYTEAHMDGLGNLLRAAMARHGRPIYLLTDEPYAKITYDGIRNPDVFKAYEFTVLVTSHSKDLGLAGERIGYAALHPGMPDNKQLFGAMAFANRILGYVNAPALLQRVVARLQDVAIDAGAYKRLRDIIYPALAGAGFEVVKPDGAFYLFPRSPIADDVAFVQELKARRVLVVPGSGFGRPGHFRLSYCVPEAALRGAIPVFQDIGRKYGLKPA